MKKNLRETIKSVYERHPALGIFTTIAAIGLITALACNTLPPDQALATQIAECLPNAVMPGNGINLGYSEFGPLTEDGGITRVDFLIKFMVDTFSHLNRLYPEVFDPLAHALREATDVLFVTAETATSAQLAIDGELLEGTTTLLHLPIEVAPNAVDLATASGDFIVSTTDPSGAQVSVADITQAGGCTYVEPIPPYEYIDKSMVPFAPTTTP